MMDVVVLKGETKEALERSAMMFDTHNEEVVRNNLKALTEEVMVKGYEERVEKAKQEIVDDVMYNYKYKNRFIKLFAIKPTQKSLEKLVVDITTPTEKFVENLHKQLNDTLNNYPHFQSLDFSALYKVFGDTEVKKDYVEVVNVEYEEVE